MSAPDWPGIGVNVAEDLTRVAAVTCLLKFPAGGLHPTDIMNIIAQTGFRFGAWAMAKHPEWMGPLLASSGDGEEVWERILRDNPIEVRDE